jgi:catechol 2,3-dioxygenase-like lactoylglutathione lyase family enzyme
MRLGYVIVYVADVPATLEFYERAFGLRRRYLHETHTYGELETGPTALAFAAESLTALNGLRARPNRRDDDPAGAEVGLVTNDVAGAYQAAVLAGATPYQEPALKPWGQTVGYVRDNNGFLVEICSPVGG